MVEETGRDAYEPGLDGDLQGLGFAELTDQVQQGLVILGRLGHDELTAHRANGRVLLPGVAGDSVLDQVNCFAEEFFLTLVFGLVAAAAAATAAADQAAAANAATATAAAAPAAAAGSAAATGAPAAPAPAHALQADTTGHLDGRRGDDDVANVVHSRICPVRQGLTRRNANDAFVDHEVDLRGRAHRGAADVVQDDPQGLLERHVHQVHVDLGGLVDTGDLEGTPVNVNAHAADLAKELHDQFERHVGKVELGQLLAEAVTGLPVGLGLGRGAHGVTLATQRQFLPVAGIAEQFPPRDLGPPHVHKGHLRLVHVVLDDLFLVQHDDEVAQRFLLAQGPTVLRVNRDDPGQFFVSLLVAASVDQRPSTPDKRFQLALLLSPDTFLSCDPGRFELLALLDGLPFLPLGSLGDQFGLAVSQDHPLGAEFLDAVETLVLLQRIAGHLDLLGGAVVVAARVGN